MKKSVFGAVVALLLIVLSCQEKSNDTAATQLQSSSSKPDTTTTLYAVPYDTAKKNMHRYDVKMRTYDSLVEKALNKKGPARVPVRAFTVRAADLLEALGLPVADTAKVTYDHVRIYFGINGDDKFKLYLTPVEGADLSSNPPKAGVDVILKGKYTGLGSYGSYVLDFSAPCPPTCP